MKFCYLSWCSWLAFDERIEFTKLEYIGIAYELYVLFLERWAYNPLDGLSAIITSFNGCVIAANYCSK